MKNFKKISLGVLGAVLLTAGLYSCSNDNLDPNSSEATNSTASARVNSDSINEAYKVEFENKVLEVSLTKNGFDYNNQFVYKIDGSTIFNLNYSLNNEEEDWKYKEQEKAINFSNQLKKSNITKKELEDLNFMIDESIGDFMYQVDPGKKNQELFSMISYLNAAVSANLRMLNNNETEITGTISPSFLVDKSLFLFQEDFVVDLSVLKENIILLETEAKNNGTIHDINMVNFIKTTPKQKVTFDEIYAFYVPKSVFKQHIADKAILKKGDCKESCVIGCDSDWGCCGNYSGCCYYSHTACLIHDLLCTNCTPAKACGPKCVPDGPEGNRIVKIIMG